MSQGGGWSRQWWWGYGKGKGKGYGKGGKNSLRAAPELKVWVGNLPEEVTWKELQAHVDAVAKSKWVEVFSGGKSKGSAAVVFSTAEDAASAAAKLNGSQLAGQAIVVDVWQKMEKPEAEPAAA
mmetsp:Transcript_68155/g.127254  ORF Transcript_68155/g.127254 Transcript_68155/m.127254 type:complete len:124 (-) Transcript_68155:144-515(-)